MRCSWSFDGKVAELSLSPDPEDELVGAGQAVRLGQRRMEVRLATNVCRVVLPFRLGEDPHPDLLAAAAYSVGKPWISKRLRMDRPISGRLASTFESACQIEASPVSQGNDARDPNDQLILSYSSGTDSIAASTLIPEESPYIHLRRVPHKWVPNRATHIRASVVADLAMKAHSHGRDVHVVDTDLEYLCQPLPTFPEWVAVGIGAVLLADHFRAGGIVFGSILEAVYLDNGRGWSRRDDSYFEVFESAGVPFIEPVGGLTEVGTRLLAENSPLVPLSRSCLLGTLDSPCNSCVKCLRKELLEAAVTGAPIPGDLERAVSVGFPGLAEYFEDPPYYMNDVLAWAFDLVDVADSPLAPIKKNILAASKSPTWMTKLYPPAVDQLVPQRWRREIEIQLAAAIDPMTSHEQSELEQWTSGSTSAT